MDLFKQSCIGSKSFSQVSYENAKVYYYYYLLLLLLFIIIIILWGLEGIGWGRWL